MCYTIAIEGKENPKNQKGYRMNECYFSVDLVTLTAWNNIRSAFYRDYDQRSLYSCFCHRVPPVVRWNNRNVYAVICKHGSEYIVTDFYRIARDGHPVKIRVHPVQFRV